jgi:hypothetical protein
MGRFASPYFYMATKIRALQSLSSNEYGKLRAGETGYCKPSTAKQLVEWGMAEIVSENEEPPKKEIKPFITMGGYEPKQESKPVLYQEPEEEKSEVKDEPEKAAQKNEIDPEKEKEKREQSETPKKQYK